MIEQHVRMVGVLACKLKLRWLTGNMSGLPHIGNARAGNSKQSGASSNRSRIHAVLFPRRAVKVVAHSKVQCETRPNLPIVFEECAPFVLVVILNPNRRCEGLIRWAVDTER